MRRPPEEILGEILDALGKPKPVETAVEYDREAERLRDAVDGMSSWTPFDRETQRAIVGLVTTRLRHLQDEVPPSVVGGLVGHDLDPIFSKLTAFSASERPGFVFGLSRFHEPEEGTWAKGARLWWDDLWRAAGREDEGEQEPPAPNPNRTLNALADIAGDDEVSREGVTVAAVVCLDAGIPPSDPRLVKVLLPHLSLLTKERRLKATRKAIRDYSKQMAKEAREADADVSAVPDDWPHWDRVEAARALVVGGDRREGAAERMMEAFRFESLEWDTGWQIRRLDSLTQQVSSGSVDLVVLLARFLSHKAWYMMVPACKAAGVPYVLVERGYGVNQIRTAMESAFGGSSNNGQISGGGSSE